MAGNEAVAPHEEGSEISGWRQEEWGPRNDRTRRSKASEQATTAGNKGFAIAAPAAAVRNFWLALSWARGLATLPTFQLPFQPRRPAGLF
jgi:hypothetical protein